MAADGFGLIKVLSFLAETPLIITGTTTDEPNCRYIYLWTILNEYPSLNKFLWFRLPLTNESHCIAVNYI